MHFLPPVSKQVVAIQKEPLSSNQGQKLLKSSKLMLESDNAELIGGDGGGGGLLNVGGGLLSFFIVLSPKYLLLK